MGLLSDLHTNKWSNKGKPPRNKTNLGNFLRTLYLS